MFWKIADQNVMFIVSVHLTWCKKMDLKIIQSLLERVQIHKNAERPKNLCELKDFSRTDERLTVQDKQGTHEQLSLNKKTSVDHSGNNTVLRIKCM